jgi:hypothetical protein
MVEEADDVEAVGDEVVAEKDVGQTEVEDL